MPHGSSVGVEVVAVLGHVGHSVGGAQVGHGGGVAHVTVGGQVHSSHLSQQLSQAGGSGHVVGSHVAVKYINIFDHVHGTKNLTCSFDGTSFWGLTW